MKPGIKFTKVVSENKVDKSPLPPPPPISGEKGDGVPRVATKVEAKETGGEGKKPLGIPVDVSPPVSLGKTNKPNEDNPVREIDAPTQPKRKPGRPKGSGNGSTKSNSKTVDTLAQQIEGYHAMAGVFVPGVSITPDGARLQAEAVQEVMEAYDIKVSRKVTALVTLIGVFAFTEMGNLKKARDHVQKMRKPKTVIQQARKEASQTIPVDNSQSTIPNVVPIPQSGGGSIFNHMSDGIAEGKPNE